MQLLYSEDTRTDKLIYCLYRRYAKTITERINKGYAYRTDENKLSIQLCC